MGGAVASTRVMELGGRYLGQDVGSESGKVLTHWDVLTHWAWPGFEGG